MVSRVDLVTAIAAAVILTAFAIWLAGKEPQNDSPNERQS